MKIITILNFLNGNVVALEYPSNTKDDEEFLIQKGFRPSDCQWMVSDFEGFMIR